MVANSYASIPYVCEDQPNGIQSFMSEIAPLYISPLSSTPAHLTTSVNNTPLTLSDPNTIGLSINVVFPDSDNSVCLSHVTQTIQSAAVAKYIKTNIVPVNLSSAYNGFVDESCSPDFGIQYGGTCQPVSSSWTTSNSVCTGANVGQVWQGNQVLSQCPSGTSYMLNQCLAATNLRWLCVNSVKTTTPDLSTLTSSDRTFLSKTFLSSSTFLRTSTSSGLLYGELLSVSDIPHLSSVFSNNSSASGLDPNKFPLLELAVKSDDSFKAKLHDTFPFSVLFLYKKFFDSIVHSPYPPTFTIAIGSSHSYQIDMEPFDGLAVFCRYLTGWLILVLTTFKLKEFIGLIK
jgi:hypothetical protein